MTQANFFARIYRLDESSQANWAPFITRPGIVTVPGVTETVTEELAREYTTALFKPLEYYRLEKAKEELGTDGSIVMVSDNMNFQVLKINKGRSRTHVIPTFQSRQQKSMVSKLALYVQPLATWQDITESGEIHVYAADDPYWCEPRDIANFTDMRQKLQICRSVTASTHAQCQALGDIQQCKPEYSALTDSQCPTLVVLQALKQLGWKQRPSGICLHEANNQMVKLCDSRGGVASKFYLQCLLDLPRSLTFSSRIPSNCRQSFYKCILAGKVTNPEMTDKQCRAALMDKPVEAIASIELPALEQEQPLPLALEDHPMAPVGGGEDGFIVKEESKSIIIPKAKGGGKGPAVKGFLPAPGPEVLESSAGSEPVVAIVAAEASVGDGLRPLGPWAGAPFGSPLKSLEGAKT